MGYNMDHYYNMSHLESYVPKSDMHANPKSEMHANPKSDIHDI